MTLSRYNFFNALGSWRHPFAYMRGATVSGRYSQAFHFLAGDQGDPKTSRQEYLGLIHYVLVLPFVLYLLSDLFSLPSKVPYIGKPFGFVSGVCKFGFVVTHVPTLFVSALLEIPNTPFIFLAHGLSWFAKYDDGTVAKSITANGVTHVPVEIDARTQRPLKNPDADLKPTTAKFTDSKSGKSYRIYVQETGNPEKLNTFIAGKSADAANHTEVASVLVENIDKPLQSASGFFNGRCVRASISTGT